MTPSQRIALNTAVTYGRSIVAMALGLLGSRWIFGSLGEVDYGLMAVVSALIATVYFINMGISSTSARYFAFSIGEGTSEQTNRWFNAALCLHVILVPVLILVVWLLGEWALRDFLNIPEARLTTALWVFRISLLSAFCGLALSPFIDMFIAKQNILEVSLWALLTSLVNFGLAFTLLYYSGDRWLFITVGMASFAIIALCAQAIRATMLYDECRIRFRLWLDFVRIWELCKFSGWGGFRSYGGVMSRAGPCGVAQSPFYSDALSSGKCLVYGWPLAFELYAIALARVVAGIHPRDYCHGRARRAQQNAAACEPCLQIRHLLNVIVCDPPDS